MPALFPIPRARWYRYLLLCTFLYSFGACVAQEPVTTEFFADRGNGSAPIPCAKNWTFVSSDGDTIAADRPCVLLQAPMVPLALLKATTGFQEETDLTLWCATTQEYSLETAEQWGFCLASPVVSSGNVTFTFAPTVNGSTKEPVRPSVMPSVVGANVSTPQRNLTENPSPSPTIVLPPSERNTTAAPTNMTFAPSLNANLTAQPTPALTLIMNTSAPTSFVVQSRSPTVAQSFAPSLTPTGVPSTFPSIAPSLEPTNAPSASPTTLPTQAPFTLYNARVRLFPYEGSSFTALEGSAEVKISKNLFMLNGVVSGAAKSCDRCRLALHEGFSCNRASGVDSPRGTFWLGEEGGFWNETYRSDAEGRASLNYVIESSVDNLVSIFGRTLVLFDQNKSRIGCGKIVASHGITAEIFPALQDNITQAYAFFTSQEPSVTPVEGKAFLEVSNVLAISLSVEIPSLENPEKSEANETILAGFLASAAGSCLDSLSSEQEVTVLSSWEVDEEGAFELELPLLSDVRSMFYTKLLILDESNRVLSCAYVQPLEGIRGQFVIQLSQGESPNLEPEDAVTRIYGSMVGGELVGVMKNFLLPEEACFSSERRDDADGVFLETKAFTVREIYQREGTRNNVANVIRSGNLDDPVETYNNTYVGIIGTDNFILGCGLFDSRLYEDNLLVTSAPTEQPSPLPTMSPTSSPLPSISPSLAPTTPAPSTGAPSTPNPTVNDTNKPILPPGPPTDQTDPFLSSEVFTLILVLCNMAIITAFLCFVFPPGKYWPKFFIDGTSRRGMIDEDEKAESTDEDNSSNLELEPQ